ncbi:hypothetical protein BGZ98_003590, partial [Dissophora globulifera]
MASLIPRKFAYRPGVVLDVITPDKPMDLPRDYWSSSTTILSSGVTSHPPTNASKPSVSIRQLSNGLTVSQTDARKAKDVDYIELINEYADALSNDPDTSSEAEASFDSEPAIGTIVSPNKTSSPLFSSSHKTATCSGFGIDTLYLDVTDRHSLSDSIVEQAHVSDREAGAIASHVHNITDLSSITADIIGKALVNRSVSLDMTSQSSLQELLHLHSSTVKATLSGELPLAESLNSSLQEQLDTSRLQMSDLYLVQMMHNQTQIMSRVDALITQTYELHEYPIPRLFIVLQKPKRHRDLITRPFKKHFRLFFLCDCGEHTMREGNKEISHKIHLAKHKGYDIDHPTEFFRKFGPYVIKIMKVFKYVVATAGLVMPTLDHFVSGIEAIQKSFSIAEHEVRPLMDETIRHIRRELSSPSSRIDMESGQADLDDIEVLEGGDLRRLESFLKIKDRSRELGSLYRVVTLTGHVKWVCIDHCHENYQQKAQRVFKELVEANGFYHSETDLLVRLRSTNVAKRFYEALIKARGIQQLAIHLKWDATMDDLRRLETAVSSANIEKLILYGTKRSKGSMLDAMNSGRRYNPILELLTNTRIKRLVLMDLGNFYHHISNPSLEATRCLESLNIGSSFSTSDKRSRSALLQILKLCSGLKHLDISLDNCLSSVMAFFKDLTLFHRNSLVIKLSAHLGSALIVYTQGSFESVSLRVHSRDGFSFELETLLRGHISALYLDVTPSNVLESHVLNAIRYSPCLLRLDIKQCPSDTFSIIDAIISTRRDILSAGGASQLKEASLSFSCLASVQSISTISINFTGDALEPTMSTEVIIKDSISSDFRDHITALIQRYGWSITELIAGTEFIEDLAAILDRTTEDKGSSLRKIKLSPPSLTWLSRDCLFRILERSKQLEDLGLEGSTSGLASIDGFGRFITSLNFSGEDVNKQIAAFSEHSITRHDLPVLKALSVDGSESVDLSQEHIAWIAEIVAPPHQDTAPCSDGELLKSVTDVSWNGIRLQPQDWKSLIAALDFRSLRKLDLSFSNFAMEQLTEMADLIRCGPYAADRLSIGLEETNLELNASTSYQ